MSDQSTLRRLAERAGIEQDYWDVYGGYHETSDETRRLILAAMGFANATQAEMNTSLAQIEDAPWRSLIDPVRVLRVGDDCPQPTINVFVAGRDIGQDLKWRLTFEDATEQSGLVNGADLQVLDERSVDGENHVCLRLDFPQDLPLGYHQFVLETHNARASCTVICAPPTAYKPDWMVKDKRRVWGVACQLYALRSQRDWGIGDFSDLAHLCGGVAKQGGAAVGLSPLHALFPHNPHNISPYSPSSRLFLNPLYIDIEAVPEFSQSPKLHALMETQDFAYQLQKARSGDQVSYATVTDLKTEALNLLFETFMAAHPVGCGSDRRRAFDDFVREGGERLMRFAAFEVLQDQFYGSGGEHWSGPDWDGGAPECADFIQNHRDKIDFIIYLQWEADRQLAEVAAQCGQGKMDIGLYRDLAVGVSPCGADAWLDDGVFADGLHFGAPPDPLAPAGQDWGMPPFNPVRLREMAYAPYVEMLRANMRHAGAIRVDHAMWMQHMFCIPEGKDGRDGAYVRFPMDDLFAILALESHRNRCLVVGEDLGTVPEGFSERMEAEGILSYRLLQFQRYQNGLYFRPDAYPALSLATPASHDLPPLAGFWHGTDLDVLREIGHIASTDELQARRGDRERDRECLIAALVDQGVLPEGFRTAQDAKNTKALIDGVHSFLARSPAALMMMNLEDIIVSTCQINVPGTYNEYPNWRFRLTMDVAELCGANGLAGAIAPVRRERGLE